jgi:hypothetical protein
MPFAPAFEDEVAVPEPEPPPGPPAFHQRPTSSSSPGPAPHHAPRHARSSPVSLCPRFPCVARARKPISKMSRTWRVPRQAAPGRQPLPKRRQPVSAASSASYVQKPASCPQSDACQLASPASLPAGCEDRLYNTIHTSLTF